MGHDPELDMNARLLEHSSKPLVLLAIPRLDAGGPDRVFFELLCGLPRERFRLALLVQEQGGRYFEKLPTDVVVEVLTSRSRYPALRFAKAVDRLSPALVMTTLRMNTTAGLARLWQCNRQPFVARQANAIAADFAILKSTSLIKHRLAEYIVRFALRRANAVVAQSLDMATELRMELRNDQRIETIGNPVSVSDIAATALRTKFRPAFPLCGKPALVSVGRLSTQKGYDLLVEAMPTVLAQHPDAHLTICGEGDNRYELERLISKLGVTHAVSLPGQSDGIIQLLASADLFVSSSRYEGFSNAILEAMALAIPVVATDCPGATREMVIDGVTGVLVEAGSSVAIASGILRAFSGDCAALGRSGRAQVDAHFDRATIVGRYAALFEEMIASA